jgi:aspartyl protease family protein
MIFILVFVLVGLAAAAAFVPEARPYLAGMEPGEVAYLALYGAFALVLVSTVASRYRGRFGAGLRDFAIWVVIAIGIIGVYSFRDDLRPIADRIRAEMVPGTVLTPAPGQAMVTRRRDGSFYLDASANGTKLSFVFDTGATTVVLRSEDARRIGIAVDKLSYDAAVATANGRTLAAPVEIAALSVGGITERRIPALVARPGTLHENLLGQTFLDRLASYSVENNRLMLKGR